MLSVSQKLPHLQRVGGRGSSVYHRRVTKAPVILGRRRSAEGGSTKNCPASCTLQRAECGCGWGGWWGAGSVGRFVVGGNYGIIYVSTVTLSSLSSYVGSSLAGYPTPGISLGFSCACGIRGTSTFSRRIGGLGICIFSGGNGCFSACARSTSGFRANRDVSVASLRRNGCAFIYLTHSGGPANDETSNSSRVRFDFARLAPNISAVGSLRRRVKGGSKRTSIGGGGFATLCATRASLSFGNGGSASNGLDLVGYAGACHVIVLPCSGSRRKFITRGFSMEVGNSTTLLSCGNSGMGSTGKMRRGGPVACIPCGRGLIIGSDNGARMRNRRVSGTLICSLSSSEVFRHGGSMDAHGARDARCSSGQVMVASGHANGMVFGRSLP